MAQAGPGFLPGTLWRETVRRSRRALRDGALRPIETEQRFVEDSGVRFLVRVAAALARKDEARAAPPPSGRKAFNPFLPYDEAMFVADVSASHVCLLNKFNVIDHHLLIVTRAFEDQEELLTVADFEALCACMAEFEGLGFYNGGTAAGASQPHKHLQIVPLPLAEGGPAVPVAPLLDAAGGDAGARGVPGLPFRHAFARLDPSIEGAGAAASLHRHFAGLLDSVGLRAAGGLRQAGPYNLIVTREWMLLVPRSRESFDGVSVNALGFAGSLFVRDRRQMRTVEDAGPMTVLRHVALAE